MAKLSAADRKKAEKTGKAIADGILKALTPSKSSKLKPGYKHNRKNYH